MFPHDCDTIHDPNAGGGAWGGLRHAPSGTLLH